MGSNKHTYSVALLILSNFCVPMCSGLQPHELRSAHEHVRGCALVTANQCHQLKEMTQPWHLGHHAGPPDLVACCAAPVPRTWRTCCEFPPYSEGLNQYNQHVRVIDNLE